MRAIKTALVALLFLPLAQAKSIPPGFTDLQSVEPGILVDMIYSGPANFVGQKVDGYEANVCYLAVAAAEALKLAQQRLQMAGEKGKKNYSLIVHDCYRPQKAVDHFVRWAANSETSTKPAYYPAFSKKQLIELNYISPVSGHSRGSSLDVSIVEISGSGEYLPLDMGTYVDFFGEESHTKNPKLSKQQKSNRLLLLEVMAPEFKNYSKEWWHFVLKNEPHQKSFNFDVIAGKGRKPQSVSLGDVITHFDQPALLAELDSDHRSPLSLANLFRRIHSQSGLPLPEVPAEARSRGDVMQSFKPTYTVFTATLSKDITDITAQLKIDWEKDITKTYSPKAAKTERGKYLRGNGNVTRIFNEKWLTSPDGQFVLAGIVNRIDRKDFNAGSCGELRFIYRLAYEVKMEGQTYASRMPFTLNMVFTYKDDGHECRAVASLWRAEEITESNAGFMAQRLLAGALDPARIHFKQLEINAQVARFPSDLEREEKRGFAGQALYLMRIFTVQDGKLQPQKLENTPDVKAILKDEAKKKRLHSYIAENLEAVDRGVFQLDDDLLAEVALSYSTLGSARLANKPFEALMTEEEAQAVIESSGKAEQLKFAGTGRALLERLNTSACMGCHQSSSTAGFHFLGVDRFDFGTDRNAVKTSTDGNRLQLAFSPHFYSEIFRRKHYLRNIVNGEPVNTLRPHPSAPPAEWTTHGATYSAAGMNMPCSLEHETGFTTGSSWECQPGLNCSELVHNKSLASPLGQCIPGRKKIFAGLSCRKNTVEESPRKDEGQKLSFNLMNFHDRLGSDQQIYALAEGKVSASEYNCRPTRIGVPLGRVTRNCLPAEVALRDLKAGKMPDEICAIVGGKGFEQMAKGYFNSKKFAAGVGRGLLNTCTPRRFCREDYICQELPDFLTGKRFSVESGTLARIRKDQIGFCTPTYFVYQLRLDGHPNPR